MTKLILIRHGETSTNVKNVLHKYGDADNLTENGKKQIEAAGEKVRDLGINQLCASNESRALESAEIIGNICDLKTNILKGMEERNWGEYSGKPWSEVKTILDPMTLEERYAYIPPRGESWEMFEKRLIKNVNNVVQKNKGETIGIITHGGSIRALMPYLLGIPKEESFKYDPKNASISVFVFENTKFKALLVDDVSHLEGIV